MVAGKIPGMVKGCGTARGVEALMHRPVMADEVLALLELEPGEFVVDGTLGFGGHALRFLEAVGPGGLVLGIEKNLDTIRKAGPRLASAGIRVMRGDFRRIKEILTEGLFPEPDAIFLDLGLSSFLLEGSDLGFSFKQEDEPLDMRYDPAEGIPASDVLNALSPEHLAILFRAYGQEPSASSIARQIAKTRPINKVRELVACVESAVPPGRRGKALHRVFQALRIFVNDELGALIDGLVYGLSVLREGGRLAIISYHSLEDRLVKRAGRLPGVEPITKKPVRPSTREREDNPRSRSGRLRVLLKKGDIDEKVSLGVLRALCPSLPFGLG
ncbi:MAG: 16S rRNA (cytosine(1402)-N(4))-methyltransferase RsmH [candidate division WOR-3 bacterium]